MNNPNKNSTNTHTPHTQINTHSAPNCTDTQLATHAHKFYLILSSDTEPFLFVSRVSKPKSFQRGNELPSPPSSGTEITPCHHLCLPHVLLFQRANGTSPLGPASVELATDPICHLHFKCAWIQLNNMKPFRVLASSVRI